MKVCEHCGGPLPNQHHNRRYCEAPRCRKAKYGGHCVECGVPTSGDTPGKANKRCRACAPAVAAVARKAWTREAILEAFRAWAAEHGEPPTTSDWDITRARAKGHDERVARLEAERWRWPPVNTVVREFGSWSAGVQEAGFTPRPPNGSGGNAARRYTHPRW